MTIMTTIMSIISKIKIISIVIYWIIATETIRFTKSQLVLTMMIKVMILRLTKWYFTSCDLPFWVLC